MPRLSSILILILGAFLLAVSVWLAPSGPKMELRYRVGRDTVDWFGDGSFQIYRQGHNRYLADRANKITLLESVDDWDQDWELVYVCGHRPKYIREGASSYTVPEKSVSYVLIDITTNNKQVFKSLEECPEAHHNSFRSLDCE